MTVVQKFALEFAKVFLASIFATTLTLGIPIWSTTGDQKSAILWSGIVSVMVVAITYLNPNDPNFGKTKKGDPSGPNNVAGQ